MVIMKRPAAQKSVIDLFLYIFTLHSLKIYISANDDHIGNELLSFLTN